MRVAFPWSVGRATLVALVDAAGRDVPAARVPSKATCAARPCEYCRMRIPPGDSPNGSSSGLSSSGSSSPTSISKASDSSCTSARMGTSAETGADTCDFGSVPPAQSSHAAAWLPCELA